MADFFIHHSKLWDMCRLLNDDRLYCRDYLEQLT